MNDDLRNSLKLWLDATVFVGFTVIGGVVLGKFLSHVQLDAAFDKV